MKKTIKDTRELTRILNTLQPMAARLLLYFILTQIYESPFTCTLYEMGVKGKVKNPQRSITEILTKGYLSRERISDKRSFYSYKLHVDLIDH